jgi:phosphonate transport system ATP-binding protein
LLRVIGGHINPTYGSVQVLDHALDAHLTPQNKRLLRRETGQIMQGLHLVQRLSALENVLIGCLGQLGGWRTWIRWYSYACTSRAMDALKSVNMLARSQTRADRLSGGERQKIAIARLLVQNPRLILADEPTAALDPAAAADVCQLLARAAKGATLVSVVHNVSLLPLLADRVIGLREGLIVFDLPLHEVSDARLIDLYQQPVQERSQGIYMTAFGQLVTSVEQVT